LALVTSCKTATAPTAGVKDDDSTSEYSDSPIYRGPGIPAGIVGGEARGEWLKYCKGADDPGEKPTPNYDNPEVRAAVAKLNQVADGSFAFHQGAYAAILQKFQTPIPANGANASQNAHDFLDYLCGEFRDRPTMIAAKLKWVAKMNYVDHRQNGEEFDVASNDVWGQVRIEDYGPYLQYSNSLYQARESALGQIAIGNLSGIDRPVPGLSVCETKYVFKNVRGGAAFPGLAAHEQGYLEFQKQCNPDDQDWYFDFRGDMNFKPNTPESNGMIWFSQTMATKCASAVAAKPDAGVTDADCKRYYTRPFKSRWDAGRAGLAAYLLAQPQFRAQIADQNGTEMTVVASATVQDGYRFGDKGPWRVRLGDPTTGGAAARKISARTGAPVALVDGWREHWADPAFGLAKFYGGDEHKADIKTLLQIAVDRHTNWYATGYDDGGALPLRGGAWSPFVASSYEMSKSDLFASGYTIGSDDPMKQWMYIFRVRKADLYNTDRVAGESTAGLDLDHFWLDERSFGTDGLAKDERAWDRLGEPLEDEYESILYLHKIPREDQGESATDLPPHL
jgi:hypothetical protein